MKKCLEAEDTSNLESDDVYSIRKRKVRAKNNISSSEDSEEDNGPLNKFKKKLSAPHVLITFCQNLLHTQFKVLNSYSSNGFSMHICCNIYTICFIKLNF